MKAALCSILILRTRARPWCSTHGCMGILSAKNWSATGEFVPVETLGLTPTPEMARTLTMMPVQGQPDETRQTGPYAASCEVLSLNPLLIR